MGRLVQIAMRIFKCDKSRVMIFFEADQGLTVFKYFLERLTRQCSGLSPNIFDTLCKIIEVAIAYYPGTGEKCLETLLLNVEVWLGSGDEARLGIVQRLEYIVDKYWRTLDLGVVADSVLNCIEVALNRGPELDDCVKRLATLAQQIVRDNLTDATLDKLMGYMNVHYMRRLPRYPLQLFYMIRILFGVFNSGTAVA